MFADFISRARDARQGSFALSHPQHHHCNHQYNQYNQFTKATTVTDGKHALMFICMPERITELRSKRNFRNSAEAMPKDQVYATPHHVA